ncbi:ankyrin repeat domain-containing protein [Legionella clemsonensis]|uniref:Phosphocholine transferase AnkX n=1 Tax=Legionella clemsonensis TaxID=1867846 RepID=A0A222NZX8_9GAMM|nr:ankyrin repeat domain-containing protein [Legionella clemsonensis]ASQ45131.1 Phosphocholine transferase AnkX [Legionella clemsonensis]
MALIQFAQANRDPEAATLFLDYGISEAVFNDYIQLKDHIKDDNEAIPDINIPGSEIHPTYQDFYIKKLSSSDPRAAILGKLTSCCQSLGDAGKDPTTYGLISPHAGFYVLCKKENGKEKIIAQCMAWRSQENYIVFDSVESQINFGNKNKALIIDFFTYLANRLVETSGIERVLVGESGQTPDKLGSLTPLKMAQPIDYRGYRDSRTQRVIVDKRWKFLQEEYHTDNPETLLSINHSSNEPLVMDFETLREIYTMFYMKKEENYDISRLKKYAASDMEYEKLLDYQKKLQQFRKCTSMKSYPTLNLSEVQELIENGIPVDISLSSGETMLHLASQNDDIDMVNWLLKRNADVNIAEDQGLTALHIAASRENNNILLLLLNHGAEVNADDHNGVTVLQCAIRAKKWGVVDTLLDRGANIHAKDAAGVTVLNSAIFTGNLGLVRRLVNMGADPMSTDGIYAFHIAARKGHSDIVQYLLEKKLNPNLKDNDGMTALLYYCASGSSDLNTIKSLIEKGGRITEKNNKGETAVHLYIEATRAGGYNPNVFEYLVNRMMSDGLSVDGEMLLHTAARCRNTQAIMQLVSLGADINLNDKNNQTPLDILLADSSVNSGAIFLLEKGADINQADLKRLSRDRVAIKEAIEKGYVHVIQRLVHNEEIANFKETETSQSLLDMAIENSQGRLEDNLIVRHLISQGSRQTKANNPYFFPSSLQIAAKKGQLDLVKLLTTSQEEHDPSPDNKALRLAIQKGHLDIVNYFINDLSYSVNTIIDGFTVLHIAIFEGQSTIVDYLINHNADVNQINFREIIPEDRIIDEKTVNSINNIIKTGKLNAEQIIKAIHLLARSAPDSLEGLEVDFIEADEYIRTRTRDIMGFMIHLYQLGLPQERSDFIARSLSKESFNQTKMLFKFKWLKNGDLYHQENDTSPEYYREKNDEGSTLLHLLAELNYVHELGLLVKKIPHEILPELITTKNNAGQTPLDIILRKNPYALDTMISRLSIKDLLTKRPELKEFLQPFFLSALRKDSLENIGYLIMNGANSSELRPEQKYRLIQHAISAGQLNIVKHLYDENIDRNHQKKALHTAAELGQLAIIKYLVEEQEADLRVACFDDDFMLPQHYAAKNGQLEVVKYLIARGVDTKEIDELGNTMLDLAQENKHQEIVTYLMSLDAEKNHSATVGNYSSTASPRFFSSPQSDTKETEEAIPTPQKRSLQ